MHGHNKVNGKGAWKSKTKPEKIQKSQKKTAKETKHNLADCFKYCFANNTVHGLAHIVKHKNHPIEGFIWTCLVSIAIYFTIRIGYSTFMRYQKNPTVISVEKDYLSWNTSFPAGTICPLFKLNEEFFEKFVEYSTVENKTLLREFLISLVNATYHNFENVLPLDAIPPEEYLPLILDLQFDFTPNVFYSTVQRKVSLERVFTEMGICYTLNSKIAVYNSPDYWETDIWELTDSNDIFYIHALDGDVFANIVNMSTGFELYIHGPYEVADIASKSIYSPNGYFLQLYLDGLTLFSSQRIRDLGINQRKCRFYDESDLRHSPAYSYVLCRMDCRAALAKRLCGCIPHFYRRLDGEKVCDVKGLHCLAKYKERLIILKGECHCLPNCDEVNYHVEDLDTREWFLGSNLQWGLKEYPKMRLRRDVIFGFSDLLVYIGGMAGLFLGCSVLSFIEIIYFFTIRLFWYVVKYREQTKALLK